MSYSGDNDLDDVCKHIKHISPIKHKEVTDLWIACGYLPENATKEKNIKNVIDEEIQEFKQSTRSSFASVLKSITSGLTAGIAISIYMPLQALIDSWFGETEFWLSTIITILFLLMIVILISYVAINFEQSSEKKDTNSISL